MVSWQDFAPASTSRIREDIEWSIHYSFHALDRESPRVLLIGDSICNGYQDAVRKRLEGRVNVSFWASSKCVTDPDYFRELAFILDELPFSMICFNNGLHSLTTDREEWTHAYRAALDFIRARHPETLLSITLSTPLKKPELTQISASLNAIALETARERGLGVLDLFSPMDGLDRETYWTDTYHFQQSAKEIQGDVIAGHVLNALGLVKTEKKWGHAATETGPDGRMD